jgi:uncharacterized protein YfaS (alpha-2-macroglobulin family)
MFETGLLQPHPVDQAIGAASLQHLDRIAAAVFVVAEQDRGHMAEETLLAQDAAIAAWFSAAAESLSQARSLSPAPDPQALVDALAALPPQCAIETRSAFEARLILLSNIEGTDTHGVR